MRTPFFDIFNHHVYLPNRSETEIRVLGVGYNDLRFVAPYKHTRTQQFFTFHYVISGKGILHFEGKTYHISAGNIFALGPNLPICYYPDEDDPWEYLFIEFDGSNANNYLQSVGYTLSNPIKSCENAENLVESFKNCLERSKNGASITHFEAISLLMAFFTASLTSSNSLSILHEDVVTSVKKILKTRFTNPDLTVAQIASALHFSHSVLCRLFHKKTGKTMIAYINEQRMKYAEELLKSTDLSANKIAYMSGFREYTYFLMLFKRKWGITTSEYRKRSSS